MNTKYKIQIKDYISLHKYINLQLFTSQPEITP